MEHQDLTLFLFEINFRHTRHISIKYNLRGPNFTTVSALASSTNALIDFFNYIKWNKASDLFIAGGSEAVFMSQV